MMRSDSMGTVLLLLTGLCLMQLAIADETLNQTLENETDANLTNEAGNETNETVDNTTVITNETNETNETAGELTNETNENSGDLTNETENQTGEMTDLNQTDQNDTASNLTEADINEAKSISCPYGAEVRFLELEKRIERNLLVGSVVVAAITENDPDADVSELVAILGEMEDLLEVVRNTDRDGNKLELAKTFVDLKKDAIILTMEFRKLAHEFMTPKNRERVMVQARIANATNFTEIDQRLNQARKNFNAHKTEEFLGVMNSKDQELIKRIREGSVNMSEIRNQIMERFQNLTSEEQQGFVGRAREMSIKNNIAKKNLALEMKQDRLEQRLERTEQLQERVREKMREFNATGVNHTALMEQLQERVRQSDNLGHGMGKQQQVMGEMGDMRGNGVPGR